jgi:hypothetical protein
MDGPRSDKNRPFLLDLRFQSARAPVHCAFGEFSADDFETAVVFPWSNLGNRPRCHGLRLPRMNLDAAAQKRFLDGGKKSWLPI